MDKEKNKNKRGADKWFPVFHAEDDEHRYTGIIYNYFTRVSIPIDDESAAFTVCGAMNAEIQQRQRMKELESVVSEVANLHWHEDYIDANGRDAETPNIRVFIARWVVHKARELLGVEAT
jgi:hypothetical protein